MFEGIPMLRELLEEQGPAESSAQADLHLFDVADLIENDARSLFSTKQEQRRATAMANLIGYIEATMPDAIYPGLKSIEAPNESTLLVRADAPALDYIKRFLELQRSATTLFEFHLSVRRVPKEKLVQLGIQSSSVLFENLTDYNKFTAGLKLISETTSPGGSLLHNSHIALMARSESTISVISQVAYVAEYELHVVQPGSVEILDPVVKVVEDGARCGIKVIPLLNDTFDINLDYVLSDLQRPIPTREVEFGMGALAPVQISVPEVIQTKIHSLLNMTPDTGAAIFTSIPGSDEILALVFSFGAYNDITRPTSKRVDALFSDIKNGTYKHRWFPQLDWSDVPALLSLTDDMSQQKDFPSSPLSQIHPPSVLKGTIALWYIEGIRESGHCPSFVPLLIEVGEDLDASPAAQRKLLVKARDAYYRWKLLGPAHMSYSKSPLDAIGLAWY